MPHFSLSCMLLFICLYACFADAQLDTDCAVLQEFGAQLKVNTEEPNWCCQEQAKPYFTCDTAQPPRVTHIKISRKQLQGTLPENIGELTELVELDVRYNQLQGSIPKSVAELTLLKTLVLYSNQFGNILFMCAHVTPTL